MSRKIELVEPTSAWQAAFFDMAAEFTAAGEWRYQAAMNDIAAYLQRLAQFAHGENLPADRVRESTYWGVEGEILVGAIRLRHSLTPALEQIGGHIGYEIRPSKRSQGYGTELLAHMLVRARQFGMTGVLITCDVENIASARVIEKNGGRLIEHATVDGYAKEISRYWIALTTESPD